MTVVGLFRNAQDIVKVAAGDIVFKEGDAGDEMYGIVEGEIELRTPNKIIATLGPDDVFGEMAVVDSSPRMATATATTDSVLAVIDRHRFLFLVHETPMFALQVMSTMAQRFRTQG
jgi:CRP/FNR family cyclic AMP-dependent transcriptional regulator